MATLGAPLDRAGRVLVEPDLTIPGHPEVFVIGDAAAFLHQGGHLLPGVAQTAMQGGAYAARTILARLEGKTLAAVRLSRLRQHGDRRPQRGGRGPPPVRLSGFLAWCAWLFLHIFMLIGFRNRVVVMLAWAVAYMTFQRSARLITESAESSFAETPGTKASGSVDPAGPKGPALHGVHARGVRPGSCSDSTTCEAVGAPFRPPLHPSRRRPLRRQVCITSRMTDPVSAAGWAGSGSNTRIERRSPHQRHREAEADCARSPIPPAWTDVWICSDPRGHLQATGRDARGRKQYRYHPAWRVCRDETKFDRMQAFAAALAADSQPDGGRHRARPGLPREKVLATVVQLLEKSLIRVGNDEYARQNRSFGLTTLRDRHVQVQGGDAALRVSRQERHSPCGGPHRSAARPDRQAVPRPARAGAVSVHGRRRDAGRM